MLEVNAQKILVKGLSNESWFFQDSVLSTLIFITVLGAFPKRIRSECLEQMFYADETSSRKRILESHKLRINDSKTKIIENNWSLLRKLKNQRREVFCVVRRKGGTVLSSCISTDSIGCHCDLVVIPTAQLHSVEPEPRFCACSNPVCDMSEIYNSDNLWQWSQLELRLNDFLSVNHSANTTHNFHHYA